MSVFKLKKIAAFFLLSIFLFTFSFSLVGAQDPTGNGATLDGNTADPGGADPTGGTVVDTHGGGNQLPNTNQSGTKDDVNTYNLLEPIGDFTQFSTSSSCPFVDYLNIVIKIFLGICAALAMIMIIAGGLQYMTSELPSFKEDGKSKITNAVLGFILALAAWAILNTLNPKLLNMCPHIPKAIINTVEPNSVFEKEPTAGNIARCTEITDPNHPCNPQKLQQYFGDKADDMSKICNVESGGNSNAESGTDKGTDGTVFSFGLFQINLLANGTYVGPECAGLFMTSSAGKDIPPAKYIQKDSNGKYHYDAMLKPGKEAQYNACKAKLLDPATNLAIAKKLFDLGGKMGTKWGSMHAWMGDYGVCASAFQ